MEIFKSSAKTEKFKKAFLEKFPDENIVLISRAYGWMAVGSDTKPPEKEYKKLSSNFLLLTEGNIIFDKIKISTNQVTDAAITIEKSIIGTKQVIEFHTSGKRYFKFRMRFNEAWMQQSLILFRIYRKKKEFNIAGTILQILALALLIYMMYRSWGKD